MAVYCGDCRDIMGLVMADKSVQACITSPPYFGLRDYKMAEQIGLEATPDAYVTELVAVFREVRRVLRDDGTLWLNLGDSYCSIGHKKSGSGYGTTGLAGGIAQEHTPLRRENNVQGLKHKDLIGIPWRVAFALQADGWTLRQDIIWSKPNPMPESVRDRCTKAHEYLFLLSKKERYYWDFKAMQEPATGQVAGNVNPQKGEIAYAEGDEKMRPRAGLTAFAGRQRSKRDNFKREESKRSEAIPGQSVGTHRPDREGSAYPLETRNKRSVWTVATKPYKGAHFATFPPALIEPCVLAGSKPGDIVLDPFAGSGMTGVVALQHGREFIGIELNPEYVALAEARIAKALEDRL